MQGLLIANIRARHVRAAAAGTSGRDPVAPPGDHPLQDFFRSFVKNTVSMLSETPIQSDVISHPT